MNETIAYKSLRGQVQDFNSVELQDRSKHKKNLPYTHLITALKHKTLSDSSPSSNVQKNALCGPALVDGLS